MEESQEQIRDRNAVNVMQIIYVRKLVWELWELCCGVREVSYTTATKKSMLSQLFYVTSLALIKDEGSDAVSALPIRVVFVWGLDAIPICGWITEFLYKPFLCGGLQPEKASWSCVCLCESWGPNIKFQPH